MPRSRPDGAHRLGVITEPIRSVGSPLVKRAAALRLRKYREQQRAFLVEGADLVVAGILSGRRPRVVFVKAGSAAARSLAGPGTGAPTAPEDHTAGSDSARAAADASASSADGPTGDASGGAAGAEQAGDRPAVAQDLSAALSSMQVRLVGERVAQKISTLDTPPDVMAVFEVTAPPALSTLAHPRALVLYVDRVADPGNLGTLLRSAVAFGATALATSPDCVDPLSPKVVRAGMGAVFGLPVYAEAPLADVCRSLGAPTVYGLAAHGGRDLRPLDVRLPAVVCVGAERAGLSPEVAALCDELVTIPLPGRAPADRNVAGAAVESLNAGVAGSIALYELLRPSAGGTGR